MLFPCQMMVFKATLAFLLPCCEQELKEASHSLQDAAVTTPPGSEADAERGR